MSARLSKYNATEPEIVDEMIALLRDRQQIEIHLPFLPPTANNYVRHSQGRHYKTKEAVKFDDDVFVLCRTKSIFAKSLRCEMHFYFAEGRKGRKSDIDNRVKPLWDALTKAGVFKDDSLIDEFTVLRMSGDEDKTVVWLEEL